MPFATRALVGATRALQRLAPWIAARLAARLFLAAPPRRRTTAPELDVLVRAERRDLAFDGGHLRTWRWGRGPVVVLLHGWGGSAGQLRAFVEPLVRAGYTAVAFDAPGHGDSSGARTSLPAFAQALMQVARELGPVHAVIAHSFGGAATSLAIARGLQLGRVVYLGAPADARVWFGKFARAMELDDAVATAARQRIERELDTSFDTLHAGALGPTITSPLLVVHDRGDAEVPWSDGARNAATAADARLHTTLGLGHRGILRDRAVVAEVLRFVAADAAEGGDRSSALDRELFERPRRWRRLGADAA